MTQSTHAYPVLENGDGNSMINTMNTLNQNGTMQIRNGGPHYFVLENRNDNPHEPIYDAVYQNVND